MSKIKLFCFPYAGGSAAIYHKWEKFLDRRIGLEPIELAGRGRRSGEPFYEDRAAAVDDGLRQVRERMDGSPYALFGHSLGSLIAYELAQKMSRTGLQPPLHCFFSGKGAPHLHVGKEKICHLMEEEEFKKELISLGGTPPEFFDHPELLSLFLPLLRNDFRLAETDPPGTAIDPLACDLTILLGKEDEPGPDQCDGWKKHTRQLCTIHYFEGGHFFLHDHSRRIAQIINTTLNHACPEHSLRLSNEHNVS